MLMRIVVLSLSLVVTVSAALSANWPAWRGPAGDGVSPEKNLPIKWSPT
jgi:outer membrane protein assembly factor BamB